MRQVSHKWWRQLKKSPCTFRAHYVCFLFAYYSLDIGQNELSFFLFSFFFLVRDRKRCKINHGNYINNWLARSIANVDYVKFCRTIQIICQPVMIKQCYPNWFQMVLSLIHERGTVFVNQVVELLFLDACELLIVCHCQLYLYTSREFRIPKL